MPTSLKLIQGPPGGGKSRRVMELMESGEADVAIEFQPIYAALKAQRRGADGHYPIRNTDVPDPLAALAGYVMHSTLREASRRDMRIVMTTSKPDRAQSMSELAIDLGIQDFSTEIVDPGQDVVTDRLREAFDSDECAKGIGRWYLGGGR